ncbi:Histone deacetylase superfamily [Corchorus olitorius]|uniref:histone deacetylase n=1 Tax=Corchorus olitorius TaxID=93759 RepID=A0A1R3IKF0_9ROSI|nr:Histone deacetylase superfamily [Corchorus olitorius]
MASETVQVTCVTNGGAKNNQGIKRKHLGSDKNTTDCPGEASDVKGEIGTSDLTSNITDDSQPDGVSKKSRLPKELTFQDMYNNQEAFDDDDDDDSDWEPVQKHVEILKWFCTNCTMVNLDDVVQCDILALDDLAISSIQICGEHKESGILKHGFYASPCSPMVDLPQVELEARGRDKDLPVEASASNSSTAVGFDERMLLHSEVEMKSHPHPERPNRLRAIAASLSAAGIFPGKCCPIPAREITQEELQKVHTLEHIEAVDITSQMFSSYFTPDTYANEHSARAARLAAGLCADLASAIFSGRVKNGFALVRPPGHHAGVTQAMGFCLHNNAAVAALAAQVAGAKKVLIVDWDVHHGNGTQEIFEQNKSVSFLDAKLILEHVHQVLYISLHRHEGGKFYPGTGAAFEVGSKGAEGYCVNIPWSRGGVGDNDYIFAFQHVVLPIVSRSVNHVIYTIVSRSVLQCWLTVFQTPIAASKFAPDFTIISAGFDAARGDPLGCCDVTPAGYAQMTNMLSALSGGKLLVILEGGYNLRSISSSATAVIKVLLGESPAPEPENIVPSKAGLHTVLEVLKIQMKYWPTLSSGFEKLESQRGMYSMEDESKELLANSVKF